MKRVYFIVMMVMLQMSSLCASTRGDVKVIEASEDIRYLGQKIAKEYLLLYHNPQKTEIRDKLYQDMERMERAVSDISSITNSRDSKNILDFLVYNQEEIQTILKEPVDREKSILMLDYSESFLEAANSIENAHQYKFSKEEKMLMSFKEIEYLLERAVKYYIAAKLDIDKRNNFKNMQEAIARIDKSLEDINQYAYPDALLGEIQSLNQSWETYKGYLRDAEEFFLPNLLLASLGTLTDMTQRIALYHKKNQ